VRSDAEQVASQAQAAAKTPKSPCAQRRPGRPKGSKNQPKADVPLTPECGRLTALRDALRTLIAGLMPLTSVVLAGHGGTPHARPLARQSHLPLMAQWRYDAALSLP